MPNISGYLGDRMELRHFLSGSMMLYAITIYLFGAAQSWVVRILILETGFKYINCLFKEIYQHY